MIDLTQDYVEPAWEAGYREHADRIATLADAWRKRWPAHCADCGGWGLSSYEESHGFKGGDDGLTAAHLAALVADGRITQEQADARNRE